MSGAGESMTLVFKREALERLADPAAAFADAREWTEVIGLVADDAPERLSAFADRVDVDPDVISSAAGQTGGLAVVRQQFATERHVFLGTSDEDRQLAQSLGWEYLPVEDAAADADWRLVEDDDTWQDEGGDPDSADVVDDGEPAPDVDDGEPAPDVDDGKPAPDVDDGEPAPDFDDDE